VLTSPSCFCFAARRQCSGRGRIRQQTCATNSFLLYWAPLRCEICFKFPLMFLFLQPGANIQAAKGSDSRRAPQIAFCYFGPLSDARFVLTSPSCFCSPAPMFGPRKDPTADVHIPAAAATLSRSRSFPFFVWS